MHPFLWPGGGGGRTKKSPVKTLREKEKTHTKKDYLTTVVKDSFCAIKKYFEIKKLFLLNAKIQCFSILFGLVHYNKKKMVCEREKKKSQKSASQKVWLFLLHIPSKKSGKGGASIFSLSLSLSLSLCWEEKKTGFGKQELQEASRRGTRTGGGGKCCKDLQQVTNLSKKLKKKKSGQVRVQHFLTCKGMN